MPDESETSAGGEERVHLRDGSVVVLRQVVPEDRELFVEGFKHFGTESRRGRFLGVKKQLSERDLDFLTQVDHECHEAIGAIDAETGAGIGVARMVRVPQGSGELAEAAVAVVDEWQGRGLGSALLGCLVTRARELGIERFLAVLRTDNHAMLTLFKQAGPVRVRDREQNILTIEVELPVDGPDGVLGVALRSVAAGDIEPAGR